ncbi:hypothetical protein CFC21_064258 [Triticum aestivum]|uniref:Gnk2-homologous domain-containing protein n=2 Tax=Triticum aestivum TaxID=4565 RepID=A0A9R1H216_WHEAT|nr:hypothetical protein CFC21_064258 [Triticum aestivum]
MASRRVLLLLAVIGSFCATPAAAIGNGNPSCSTKDNYTDGSQYKKSLDELLAALPAAAGDNGWFYNGTAGLPGTPDQVFGLVMCYADSNAMQCQECLADAPARITSECPGSRNVSAAYDACVLRYSPASSFSVADLDVGVLEATSVAGVTVDPTRMFNAWLKLMTGLTGQAASSPSRVANGTTAYDGDAAKLVYGLAQCTRDLNGSACSGCLSSVVGQLTATFKDQTGGAIKAYSCYVKYQLGAFDITLPPEPPQPSPQPPPPPPSPRSPPPPSAQPGESSSGSRRALVIGLSVGSVSSLIILGSLVCLSLRRRKRAVSWTATTWPWKTTSRKGPGQSGSATASWPWLLTASPTRRSSGKEDSARCTEDS